jgi:uncharacterized protein (TIGR00369 family)
MIENDDRTRTFSWADPSIAASQAITRPGLQLLREIMTGRFPGPPFASALDMALVEASDGRTVFELEPAEWMYNPVGTVHGGVAATLLDSCMACAVYSILPAGVASTTTDLQVRYLRPITLETGRVRAEGSVVHIGRRTATTEGRLLTIDNTLLAHGTSGIAIIRRASQY